MDFETPAVCPPLGRVEHFQAPLRGLFFCGPGARLRMSYAGHEDAPVFPSSDVQLGGCASPASVCGKGPLDVPPEVLQA